MKTTVAFLGGAALGAGLIYFADPTSGKRRRALARNTAAHGARVFGRVVDIASRDTAHRLKGIAEETKALFNNEIVPDEILEDRIRTEVGRVSSHPNVQVTVKEGRVTLQGPVVDSERRAVLKAVKSVKGVCGIVNRMEPYQIPGGTTTQARRTRQLDIFQTHWSPATRILVGAIGASLAAAGATTGTRRGAIPRAVGLALVARAVTNMGFKRLLGISAGHRAVDTQKTKQDMDHDLVRMQTFLETGKRPNDAVHRFA